jgi:hypothetical protein
MKSVFFSPSPPQIPLLALFLFDEEVPKRGNEKLEIWECIGPTLSPPKKKKGEERRGEQKKNLFFFYYYYYYYYFRRGVSDPFLSQLSKEVRYFFFRIRQKKTECEG